MTLKASEIGWAIDFLARHGDGDLFPRLPELGPIHREPSRFIGLVEGKDLSALSPAPHRRFIVPKDDVSYRTATQLHPQDSILLTAIVYKHGRGIEDRRRPKNQVFSYRFAPDKDSGLYGSGSGWNDFWKQAAIASQACHTVLYCDIADFYNQIYHHTLENQLIDSGFPNQATKWVIKLLESTTAGVSRGLPIGPHAVHLLAEATMIPIDNSLLAAGLTMLRYADDMVFFCDSEKASRLALAQVSTTLDKQQRLMLQRHKTRFISATAFEAYCEKMIEDRSISEEEDEILQVIRKYSGGNPYQSISYNQISEEDWKAIDEGIVRRIVLEYLGATEVDYIRLRWFYRRLTQVGHPGAVDVSLEKMDRLGPCFGNICTYLASVQTIEHDRWQRVGGEVLKLLDSDEVKASPYFRLSLLSLFTRNKHMNHFASLVRRFDQGDADTRREVLLAAWEHGAADWVREKKEDFGRMDPWQQLAFVASCSNLPSDERKYLLNSLVLERPFETALAAAIKKN